MGDVLTKDIIVRIHLRDSISTSGDLNPLSCISGAHQGTPNLTVWAGARSAESRRLVTANAALAEASLPPSHRGRGKALPF